MFLYIIIVAASMEASKGTRDATAISFLKLISGIYSPPKKEMELSINLQKSNGG